MIPRITPIEQLDYAPGLAVFTCDGCGSVDTLMIGTPLCTEFDRRLKTNSDGKTLRCAECLVDCRGDLND